MPTDRGFRRLVAWLMLGACGPAVRPPEPPGEPLPVTRTERAPRPVKGGREVMIGEMCPQAAAGRPAVTPLVMRTAVWNDGAPDVANVVDRGGVPRFAVFGVDGKVAGVFDTLGMVDVGLGRQVAAGTYVGAPPCTADAGKGQRLEDPRCAPATAGCGLAIGELGRADDPPPLTEFKTAGACLAGDALALDVDGDGTLESFPLASALDGFRSPAKEWSAAPTAGAKCKPTFQIFGIKLGPRPEPGKAVDPKQLVEMTVLGVVDVDRDGRRELILALKFPTVRTVVVYTATGTARRLELAGEGEP